MTDKLQRSLLEIVSDPRGRDLILAGGYGIVLKRQHVVDLKTRNPNLSTVIDSVPEARSTIDLDFFLPLQFFVRTEQARAVAALLKKLQYQVKDRNWKFVQPAPDTEASVEVDLLSAKPPSGANIRTKGHRVGVGRALGVHGYLTPEAFAVEEMPQTIELLDSPRLTVRVPHPYSWINMKVEAAWDWHDRRQNGRDPKPDSEKHVEDVYRLVAMLTRPELEECQRLSQKFERHEVARQIRQHAAELFGTENAPGCKQVRLALDQPDIVTFREALADAIDKP